ncbi:MAG: OmpA family protein [Bacteroidia bacterium]|nr:OmpA family protein [Bacteroidia bacterium]
MKNLFWWIGIVTASLWVGYAQPTPPKGISRRAYELYLAAVRAAQARQSSQALQWLAEAVRIEPDYEDAWILKGKLHLAQGDLEQTHEVGMRLDHLRSISPAGKAWSLYFRGKAYMAQMAYDSAEVIWRRFVVAAVGHVPRSIQDEGALLLTQSIHAARLLRQPVPFQPRNLGSAINSPYEEYLPSLTADGRRLFYTSRRPKEGVPAHPLRGNDEDLYWAERDSLSREWNPAQPLGPPINSPQNEGAAFFSADGQWAFLTLCDRTDGYGSCDLYFSELKGFAWSEPRNLGPDLNTAYWESHPSLTHDRKRLYFASGRPGGQGGTDIWYSDWREGKWQKPQNIGPPINTPGDEYSPMIAADGRTLYFASDYHPGMGGQDLFITFLTDTGWSLPRNLGYPLNTPADEQTLCIDARGEIGYVSLVRPGGMGKEDIYEFPLWPEIRPQKAASYVRGRVIDKQTQLPVAAFIVLVEVQSRDTIRSLHCNPKTGDFLVSLPLGQRYALFAKAEGYLFYSGHFDLMETDTAYTLTVQLERLQKGSRLTLRNVFFEFDRAELRPESAMELDEVVRLLKANPSWQIEIQGHTDSIGSPSYNQSLSQRRAEAVRSYLIQKGISSSRMIARGYGANRPLASNNTEEGRALNRRTEILFIGAD